MADYYPLIARAIAGLRENTMVRADEWHFLRLGQYLEGADMGARILDAMFALAWRISARRTTGDLL